MSDESHSLCQWYFFENEIKNPQQNQNKHYFSVEMLLPYLCVMYLDSSHTFCHAYYN